MGATRNSSLVTAHISERKEAAFFTLYFNKITISIFKNYWMFDNHFETPTRKKTLQYSRTPTIKKLDTIQTFRSSHSR